VSPGSDRQGKPIAPKVLVIDDDRMIRESLRLLLQEEGFAVVTADNGRTGLHEASRAAPDLIVLDIEMPVMDGRDFAASYVEQMRGNAAAMLCITAGRDDRRLPCQCQAVLHKPFDLVDLMDHVLELLP
jgi:DNA-binding response OmpR family regulator